MNHNLHQLMEMFPHLPYENLKSALDSTNNNLELSISILLSDPDCASQTTEKKQPIDQELLEMFPDLDLNIIQKTLRNNKHSIEDTITSLLTIELIQNDNISGELIHNDNNFWKDKEFNIQLIEKFTLVKDSKRATELYLQSKCNIKLTIIKIINDNIKCEPISVNHNNTSQMINRRKKIGGRVQASYIRQTKSQPNTRISSPEPINLVYMSNRDDKLINQKLESHDNFQILQTENYLLNHRKNDSLKAINPNFIKKCAIYFNGDLKPCNNILNLINEWNCEALTFNLNAIDDSNNNNNEYISSDTLKRKRYDIKSNKIDNIEYNSNNHHEMIDNLFIDYKLDFHGFLVPEALQVLNICMKKWWLEEMTQRELNKISIKLVKVKFVKNLKIITGRGLHSQSGFSRIKFNVKKYLQLNHYQFWEESAFFEIYGRKNGHVVL